MINENTNSKRGIMMEGWKEYKISDIAKVTSSKRIYLKDYVPNGIPFFRSKEIIETFEGKDISNTLFITESRYSDIKSKFGGDKTGVIAKAWTKTFYRLLTLRRYYNLLDQDSSVETLDNSLDFEEIKTLCPLRLWDVDFDSKVKEYKFISFRNEQITISGKDVFLWEMASGKNTIEEIVNHSESPFAKGINSLNYVFNFYQQLEEKFALIFRAF